MADSYSSTWFGVGFKGGLSLGPGFEDLEGFLFNTGDPTARFWCGVSSLRIGLGFGGSVGLTAIVLTNCTNVSKTMHNRKVSDWGIDFALVEKWSAFAGMFKHYDFYKSMADWGRKQEGVLNAERLDLISKVSNNAKSVHQGRTSKDPEVLTFDLPLSFGLEASIAYKPGTFRVYSESEGWSRRARYVKELDPSAYAGKAYTSPTGQKIGTFASDGSLMMRGGRIPVK